MNRRWLHLSACLAVLSGMLFFAQGSLSRQASPVASTEGLSLAGSGLENPRGVAWGPDGTLYVTEASTSAVTGGATPVSASEPFVANLDGDIVKIASGCPVVFQGNLPSSEGHGGADLGPTSIAFLNGQLYLLDEGGGASHGNAMTPDGIYLIPGDGSARVVADIGAWVSANPVANPPADPDADGDLTSMIVNNGNFLVLESNGGQLLQVTPDGKITRLADLSAADARPSGIAVTTNGGILVGQGNAVVAIAADGSTSNSWTGLKDVVDVAVGPDGTLYALEADGRVVRQSGSDAAKDVATGFQDPSSLAFGPDGGLYVSSPASGGDPTAGSVVRLSTDFGQVLTMSPAILTGSPCLPTPTPTAPPVTPATGTPGSGTPAGSATSTQAAGSTVEIKNFAFNPTSLTVSAGTTVTWTNNDAVAHTVTASDGSFDSGNLAPGDSWSHTFTAAGSFDYRCNYHPDMLAKVIVN